MSHERRWLYLMRHAKSSWEDSGLDDLERPLNRRGMKAAPEMGRRLLAHGHGPELIISSPAARAQQTAGLVAGVLGLNDAQIALQRSLYFEGIGGLQFALEQVPNAVHRVMFTGHNPTMSQWVQQLSGASIGSMPTAAIAVIAMAAEPWSRAASMPGELLAYDTPKGTGSLALSGS